MKQAKVAGKFAKFLQHVRDQVLTFLTATSLLDSA